jgi:hypothetical protein
VQSKNARQHNFVARDNFLASVRTQADGAVPATRDGLAGRSVRMGRILGVRQERPVSQKARRFLPFREKLPISEVATEYVFRKCDNLIHVPGSADWKSYLEPFVKRLAHQLELPSAGFC